MFIEKLFSRTKNKKNKPTILKFTEFNAQQKKVLNKEHKKLEVFKKQRENSLSLIAMAQYRKNDLDYKLKANEQRILKLNESRNRILQIKYEDEEKRQLRHINNMAEMKRKLLEKEAKKQINDQIRQNKIENVNWY
jgi:hypothetical protein